MVRRTRTSDWLPTLPSRWLCVSFRGSVPHRARPSAAGRGSGRHSRRDDRDVPAEQDHHHPGHAGRIGRRLRPERYDPDPTDEQYETTILYLIREQGRLRIETDHWTMGIFSLDTWRHVLRETGFDTREGRYQAGEDQYTVFACVKTG
jgi:hypothetical protein